MIAVFRAAKGDVDSHPVLALRSFLVLLLFVPSYNYCVYPLGALYVDMIWYLRWHLSPFLFSYKVPSLFFLVPSVLIPCIGYVAAGWIVARVHRPYEASFTLMNAILIILVGTSQVFWFVEHMNPPRECGPLFLTLVHFRAVPLVLFAVSYLIGGFWARSRQQRVRACYEL
ncbi:MAG TPA: hypothetical protein VIY69_18565 [Candidatus Acidoferrales bacterium]